MLAVRTPGAPQAAREDAVFDSAFPFERQGRLLRSRSISGLYSRSLHSGLQPPCLRFATAVTGRHARLGSRLLARLCRGRHRRRQTSTRLQGATPTPPYIRVRIRRFTGLSANGFFSSAPEAQTVGTVGLASAPLNSAVWASPFPAVPKGQRPGFSTVWPARDSHIQVSFPAFGPSAKLVPPTMPSADFSAAITSLTTRSVRFPGRDGDLPR
jgi:hypothetical protein